MRILLVCVLIAAPASGQIVSPLNAASVDTSLLATKVDMQATALLATSAKTAADAACQPDAAIPPMEVVGGSPGTGIACRLANAVQPRISRTVSGITAAGGSGSVSWPAMTSVPKLTVTPYVAAGAVQAPSCFPVAGSITTTGATIKCFTSQSVTVAILGAVVAPITTAAAGVQFDVLALPQS